MSKRTLTGISVCSIPRRATMVRAAWCFTASALWRCSAAPVRLRPRQRWSSTARARRCCRAIDSRVHLSEPGLEYRETVSETAQLAAQGGIATIIAQPDTTPPTDRPQAVFAVSRRSREARHARALTLAGLTQNCEGEQLAELGMLAEAGAAGFPTGWPVNGWRRYRAPDLCAGDRAPGGAGRHRRPGASRCQRRAVRAAGLGRCAGAGRGDGDRA